MENFRAGYIDYRYLREKGYPEKSSIKLVGDRYRLSRTERNALFRGVIPDAVSDSRKRKIIDAPGIRGESLGLDWYNVLITVESHLRGLPLFISDDGITRDSSATHGSYRRTVITDRAQSAIFETLSSLAPARVDVFLDSPIAFSALMAGEIRERLSVLPLQFTVSLQHSADFPLKAYDGIVATSDSVILDSALRVCDLPRIVLEESFRFTPAALPDFQGPFPSEPARWSGSENPGS